ncbi:biotin synthase BioB [Dehalococcoidia bacterium]|nr:biotin synthase BioB [Dehalococcoidia bacterium]
MNYQYLAQISLQGLPLEREQCYSVLRCPQEGILELLQSAFRVRERYFGKKVIVHLLINAKSGLCAEDCAYCSQSAGSQASIESYPLLDEEKILEVASVAKANQAQRYCIVTSGCSPSGAELAHLCRVIRRIKETVDIEICTSLGFLTEDAARRLKEAGVDRYNHNLNTSQRFYPRICTTHSYADRIETLQRARKANLKLCCGALFGMGESEEDVVDLAFALREVGVDSIPINFLHPIPGTPLETMNYLTPLKCLAILSLIRFLNPWTEIRIAGGREYHLRSLQPLALYAANSIFVSGYLTTDGQSPDEDFQMIRDMGFEVAQGRVGKIETTL